MTLAVAHMCDFHQSTDTAAGRCGDMTLFDSLAVDSIGAALIRSNSGTVTYLDMILIILYYNS